MFTQHDPDEYEAVSKHTTCAFHVLHPGQSHAGCTCSSSYSSRRRSPEEIAAIKAERQRKHEDRILAEAEMIRARRGLFALGIEG